MANSSGSLDRAFEELIQRVVESTMVSVRGELARLTESATAHPGHGAVPSQSENGRVEALQQAVNAILAPTGQTDIMAAALKSSANVAGAAALFVRRADAFTLWRSEALPADQANKLKTLNAWTATSGPLKDMCDGLRSVTLPASSPSWPSGLDTVAGGSPNICLLPIMVAGKVVAAIAVPAGSLQDVIASLEIIARIAGLSLETSSTRSAASSHSTQSAASSAPPPTAEPIPPVSQPSNHAATASQPDASRGSFADVSPSSASSSTLPLPPEIESVAEADQDSHRKAHRFARVAVQDLLSYHKGKIADGRNNRNLYDVLREDIEKTRENYQKKFASTAAASFDYLHYEMVAKLAGNDLGVLGRNYPGPVSV
jgi:hypothetical protein